MNASQSEAWDRLVEQFGGPHPAYCLELARRYTSTYPDNYPGWLVLANSLWDLARFGEARTALLHAYRSAPADDLHFVFVQLGHFHTERGDHRRAARWFRRAVRSSGGRRYHVFVGASLARRGMLDEAMTWHRTAIDLMGDHADEAHFNMGLLLRAQGRYVEALASFDRAIALDPDYDLAKEAREDALKAARLSGELRLLDP